MKFSEAIKALEEYPWRKFVTRDDGYRYEMSVDDNFFRFEAFRPDGSYIDPALSLGMFNDNIDLGADWQESKQYITWQEAIQAWADFKVVVCEIDGETWTYDWNESPNGSMVSAEDKVGVCPNEIKRGKWYIKEN